MKKLMLLVLTLSFAFQPSVAQKESWNWYFGDQAGLNFSTGSPVPLTNSVMFTIEGTASISDSTGNLLFYTNGIYVYDSSHNVMPNGTGLLGDPSSTQSALILKKPASDSLYYIFTVDFLGGSDGLQYSVVDKSLNNGKGDIIEKNTTIRLQMREKLTAIRHSNEVDYWILGIDWQSDSICAFLLDSSGLNMTPIMSFADSLQMQIITPSTNRANGYMKANREGTRIAMGLWNANSFDLFDFNTATGEATNHIKIQGDTTTMYRTYGVEFSPDGSKLYGTTGANNPTFKLLQFDLNAGSPVDIFNSRDTIAMDSLTVGYYFLALQLGPDGKIYVAQNTDPFLGVINYPDLPGAACGYVNAGVLLGGNISKYGLPNFPADYVLPVSTGINEIGNNEAVEVYPNPAQDLLTIHIEESKFNNADCVIIDIAGKVVLKTKIRNAITNLNVEGLASGIYILEINIGEALLHRKIMLK